MLCCDRSQIIHYPHRKLAVTVQIIHLDSLYSHLLAPRELFFYRICIVKVKNMRLVEFIDAIPKNQIHSFWLRIGDKFLHFSFIIVPQFPSKVNQAILLPCLLCIVNIVIHRIVVNRIRRRGPPRPGRRPRLHPAEIAFRCRIQVGNKGAVCNPLQIIRQNRQSPRCVEYI